MTSSLFSFLIVCAAVEFFLQLFWVKSYFFNGIYLNGKEIDIALVSLVPRAKVPSYLLRNFDLKKISDDELLMRQGKFGISRNIFFHGFVRIDRNNDLVKVRAYLDLNVIIFSMACGSWLVENEWLGIASGGAIAWIAARYFVDQKLLMSVAERAYNKSHEQYE